MEYIFNGLFFTMNIISGCARNLTLTSLPDSEVRPTAARARKALFDSLGNFSGLHVLDLFSGSGALALEAASRGAASVTMVEQDPGHIGCIRENCRRVTAAGCQSRMTILDFDVMNPERYLSRLPERPDLIFADPPYARSGEYFRTLMENKCFCSTLSKSRLIWEIPDTPGALGCFMNVDSLTDTAVRRFGSTLFLLGTVK